MRAIVHSCEVFPDTWGVTASALSTASDAEDLLGRPMIICFDCFLTFEALELTIYIWNIGKMTHKIHICGDHQPGIYAPQMQKDIYDLQNITIQALHNSWFLPNQTNTWWHNRHQTWINASACCPDDLSRQDITNISLATAFQYTNIQTRYHKYNAF